MRRRIHPIEIVREEGSATEDSCGVQIEIVRVENPDRLVTLEDPSAPPTLAADAFARLRPPEGATPDSVAAWREGVAKVAKAVRVMGAPTAADVPAASHRSDVTVGTVREEAVAIARETKNPTVEALTLKLLDKFGVR